MKFAVKIEFDGKYVVGYVPDIGACYIQALNIKDITPLMKMAIEIYRDNYKMRMEPFTPEREKPKFKEFIQFSSIDSEKLGSHFRKNSYTCESSTKYFHLYRKSQFPFDRILIPNVKDISPLIVKKLFGAENVSVIKSESNKFQISGQA